MSEDQLPSSSSRGLRLWKPLPTASKPLSNSEKRKEKRAQLAAEKAAAHAAEFTPVLSSAAQNFMNYLEEKLQADRSPELTVRFVHAAKIFAAKAKFEKFNLADWQAQVPTSHASAQLLGSWTPSFLASVANYGIQAVKPSQYAALVRALAQKDVEMLRADPALLESFKARLQQASSRPQFTR